MNCFHFTYITDCIFSTSNQLLTYMAIFSLKSSINDLIIYGLTFILSLTVLVDDLIEFDLTIRASIL